MSVFVWLVALTLRATAVLLASLALAVLLRRAGAAARHQLFTLTAVGLLALPVLGAVLPRWEVQLLPTWMGESRPSPNVLGMWARTDGLRAALTRAATPVEPGPAGLEPGASATAATWIVEAPPALWARLAVVVWLLGVLGSLLGLLHGLGRERRLVAASRPLDGGGPTLEETRQALGIRATVRWLVSDDIEAPATCGWWQPSVLLPASAVSWPAERRRVVLQHELVHVLRADALRHFLWRLVSALYWFQPLSRVASRRASAAREEACDEAVLGLGNRPSAYARHLLEIAESLRGECPAPVLALAMVDRGQLERRLRMILDPNRPSGPGRGRAGLAALALGSILLCTAAATPLPRVMAPAVVVAATAVAAETPKAGESVCVDGLHGNFDGTYTEGPQGTDLNGVYEGSFALQQHLGDGQRLCARVRGAVRFDEGNGSILALPPGGSVLVETREGRRSQRMLVTEEQGQPRYQWWLNGEARAADDAAQGWLRDALQVMAGFRAIGKIQGQVGSLQGEIGSIQGQVGGLQGEIGSIQGQEGSLQGKLGEIQGEMGGLQGEIGSEQGAIGGLQGARWQADAAEQRRIDREIASHEAAIRKLEAEMAARRFPERIAAAEREIHAFADVEAKRRIAEIERQIQEVRAPERIAQIERQIADLHADDRIREIERGLKPVLERLKGEVRRIAGL
jgi:beta-lactamase regulating signal transducer with metallopeptidase domain/predicted  nucleic acid-binding Zn-ribbon protein